MFQLAKVWAWVRKNFDSKDVVFWAVIVVLYFVTRLINLSKFPIFTDEGIYINWAKIAWKDATWRFISLTDGKQPLHVWGMIPFLKLFPNDPLLAGRLFSVLTGLKALAGIYAVGFLLWGKRAANWAAVFYIFTPFFLFYDRMALIDSGVNAFAVWTFFFSVLLVRTMRLDVALLMGLVTGFGLLAKSSSKMFVALSALSPVLVWEKNIKRWLGKIFNFGFLYGAVLVLSLLIYNVQRLSPFLHFVAEKNKTFVRTVPELLANPFESLWGNLRLIPLYVTWESAFVLPFIALLGLILVFKTDRKLFWYVLAWLILPYLAISLFAKVIFPRYLIFFGSFFALLAAYYLSRAKKSLLTVVLVGLYILSVGYFSYTIVFDQAKIPFPPVDRGQYIVGSSSGFRLNEIVSYARQKSQEKPVVLIAEGNFGVVGDMLNAQLTPGDRIEVRAYWPLDEENLKQNMEDVGEKYVFVVFAHRMEFPGIWPIDLIGQYEKPGGESSFYFFELKPSY